jgi:hypothetical protein
MEKTKPEFGILVLGFNRPELLERTLHSLKINSSLSETNLFLSLDGPRYDSDAQAVNVSKKVFDDFAQLLSNSSKLFSDTNQGLRTKVLESVTEAFKTVDRLLVLEDDCLIGESSIGFFNWGFEQMSSSDDIGVISGTYLGPGKSNKAFLAKRFSSWGWATNKRTWQRFLESSYSQVPLVEIHSELTRLTAKDPFPYRYEYRMISKNLSRLDSWAIPFDMCLRSENLLAIKPTVNQIQNIGFGDNATHTGRGSSLSIETGHLDVSKLQLADPDESVKIERAEAWSKFGKLANELLSRR